MPAKNPTPEKSLSVREIRAVLESFELAATDQFCEQIRAYIDLLLVWNRRISLTSIVSPEEIVRTHFAESLLATKAATEILGRLADVGTGAGFPGLALKIAFPALSVILLEPNLKKCAFLNEVKSMLDLHDLHSAALYHGTATQPRTPS